MTREGGTLALLYGGPSAEHEVSCVSARHLLEAAVGTDRNVLAIGVTRECRFTVPQTDLQALLAGEALPLPDEVLAASGTGGLALEVLSGLPPGTVVFPLLHGPFGEDGVVQGLLEALGLPYVGAGVLASAMCMDKGVAKSLLGARGLPQARSVVWRAGHDSEGGTQALVEELGLPIFVKPANLGSSIGISRVTSEDGLPEAIALARQFDETVIFEEAIAGREIELALIGNAEPRVLGAGEVVPSRPFYDYEDKYVLGAAELRIPAALSSDELAEVSGLARRAYSAMHVEGLARIDFFLDATRGFLINEINTMPGFTPISMFPRLWMAGGHSFPDLVEELVELGFECYHRRSGRKTLP